MGKALIGTSKQKQINYDLKYLTRHGVVLGTTGSGKTVMCKVLIEEALMQGVPVIAIDPKGDIGGLGISNKDFDFRPFISKSQATKAAKEYKSHHYKNSLNKFDTQIFTPKSKVGIPISLLPDLSKPKVFDKNDNNFIANFVVAISESITQLSGLKSNKEKVETLISQILVENWSLGKDMTIASLIDEIISPSFNKVGSLELEDFLKEKDRKKAAGTINLLLSSPAKKIWKEGVSLDIGNMLKKNKLSIFDLRYTNLEEKQFVVEQVMQKLYKYLLEKGGNEKLKYILYIDELAGLLPPPPANPPSKKLLELLIRQARAFGLGILVATQNPGDIDYKILGNIGARFIGKLRTDNDIEKVATSIDISQSELKEKINSLKTGMFYFNNSVTNSSKIMSSRWLYTYHSGPLSETHIKWINNSDLKPEVQGSLDVKVEKQRIKHIDLKIKKPKSKLTKREVKEKSYLNDILKQVRKHSDKTQVKVAVGKKKEVTPHLKVVVEIKPYKGEKFELQGPFLFDLLSRSIPVDNYLKGKTWSTYISKDLVVPKNKRNINDAILYCKREARRLQKTRFYESPLTGRVFKDKEEIVKNNYQFTKSLAKDKIEKLKREKERYIKDYENKIKFNKKTILDYQKKLLTKKVKRTVKNVFATRKLVKKTSEMKHWEKRIASLKKQNETHKTRIEKHKARFEIKKQKILDQAFDKARIHIRQKTYIPRNKDMIVHSQVLLV